MKCVIDPAANPVPSGYLLQDSDVVGRFELGHMEMLKEALYNPKGIGGMNSRGNRQASKGGINFRHAMLRDPAAVCFAAHIFNRRGGGAMVRVTSDRSGDEDGGIEKDDHRPWVLRTRFSR